MKTDICNSSCNEISEERNNTVSYILTITPISLVYPLKKNMGNKENHPKDKKMSDIVWLLHLSVMISSLALKGQELYIITSGLVRRVPGVEGPVASYTCTAPKAALVKDVGLPRDWPILLEILSDGSILLRAYGQRPRCPNHHGFVCDWVSCNSDSDSDHRLPGGVLYFFSS